MIKLAVALRYAKALFNLGTTIGKLERALNDFESIQVLFDHYPKLFKFLVAPQVNLLEKEKVLKSCLKDQVDSTFLHFLLHLIKQRRLSYLKSIALEYRLMVDEYLGIWEAKIITAIPIGDEIEEKLRIKLEEFYQKKIKIKKEIDPKIMGGAILLLANEMIDWSVAGRLKKIKEKLISANA